MPGIYPRPIEPLIAIVLSCMRWKSVQANEVRRQKDDQRTATINPRGDYNAKLLRKS